MCSFKCTFEFTQCCHHGPGYRTIYCIWTPSQELYHFLKNKTDSPFTSSSKLSIAPHLGWEFVTTSLLHALILSGLIMYRPCTPYHNHCEFTLALSCYTEEHYYCVHQLSLTDRGLLVPFSRWPLSIWRKSTR